MKDELVLINISKSNEKELIIFLESAIIELKSIIKNLNSGCCGYLALKIAELLIENEIYSFQFGVIGPLWSRTGLKAFKHIWVELYIDDCDTLKIVELNKGKGKKDIELIKQFYMMPALRLAFEKENDWAWGPALTEENKSIIDNKIAEYMKSKTLHYAKNCKNAGEEIGQNIFACKMLSNPDKTIPFSIDDKDTILYKWIQNIESGKMDVIKEVKENGVILTSLKEISFVGLLERYYLGQQKEPCGKILRGKQIGCHTKIDCEYYKQK